MGPLAAALPFLAIGASVVGGVTGAIGAEQSAAAQQQALNYQAQVAANNAKIAQNSAQMATAAGEQQAATSGLKTRANVGAIVASQAAGNVDVNSGSALDVRSSAAELGQLDALTIRSNAAKTAYGYETQAAGDTAQSTLDIASGQNASNAGGINAFSSLLGGASGAGSQYAQWSRLAGGSSSGGGMLDTSAGNDPFGG